MMCSHLSASIALLAFIAAGALLGYASKLESCGKSLVKAVAFIALILSLINLACLSYCTISSHKSQCCSHGMMKGEQCDRMRQGGEMMHDGSMMMPGGQMMHDHSMMHGNESQPH